MYYKRLFKKEKDKKDLLYDFAILESKHKSGRGESRAISLHCKYNFGYEKQKFSSEEFNIYLFTDEVTDLVSTFIKRWGFRKVNELPKGLQHILGIYKKKAIALENLKQ